MRLSGGGAPAGVESFLDLAALLDSGDDRAAEATLWAVLGADADEREELIFRIGEGFTEEKRRFIEFNNRLVARQLRGRTVKRLLVLLPFCVQRRACPHHIAWQLDRCQRCGQCDVGPMLDLCDHYGMEVRMVLRSRFAPGFVAEVRPDLVLAVACEHELLAGILRIAPRHCYCVFNTRPDGYCRNTRVPVEELERAVRLFLADPPGRAGGRHES